MPFPCVVMAESGSPEVGCGRTVATGLAAPGGEFHSAAPVGFDPPTREFRVGFTSSPWAPKNASWVASSCS